MGIQGGGGGGGSASRGYNYNTQLSQALQTIWGPQGAALQNMYGGVSRLMNQQAGQVPGASWRAAEAGMPYAQQGMRQMSQFANPNSGLARQQLGQYSQQVGQEFARNILPQLRTGAGIGGNMGGSREALARGVAGGDAAQAIAQGGTDIYSHQYDQALQAAGALPQMAQNYYSLRMQPYQSAWAPFTQAAGIFGGPQALSGQQSFGLAENWNNQMGNPTKPNWGFSLG